MGQVSRERRTNDFLRARCGRRIDGGKYGDNIKETLIKGDWSAARYTTITNCVPPKQEIVSVFYKQQEVAFMGDNSGIGFKDGQSVNVGTATLEQCIDAVRTDESVY